MSQFLSFDPFGFEATTLSTGTPGGVTNRIWAASMQSLNELEFNELFLRFLIYEILIAALIISFDCYKCDNNDKNMGKTPFKDKR